MVIDSLPSILISAVQQYCLILLFSPQESPLNYDHEEDEFCCYLHLCFLLYLSVIADRGIIWVSCCKLEIKITSIHWSDIQENKTVALKLVLVASSSLDRRRRGGQGSTDLHLSSVADCSCRRRFPKDSSVSLAFHYHLHQKKRCLG